MKYAVIVSNPEIENSSDFICFSGEPILSGDIPGAKRIMDAHLFGMIDSGYPSGFRLTYEIVPWFGNDFGKPVFVLEKEGSIYREKVPG